MLQNIKRYQKRILIIVFILFFIGYFLLGLLYSSSGIYTQSNMFLDADTSNVFNTFSREYHAHRNGIHPLFKLFTFPLYSFLNIFIQDDISSAIILTSLCGTAQLWFLLLIFIDRYNLSFTTAILFTVIYGVSVTQIIFSSIPETYIFSGLALLMLYYLSFSVSYSYKKYLFFLFMTIVATGITIFNIAFSLFLLFFWILKRSLFDRSRIKLYVGLFFVALFIVYFFSILSSIIFEIDLSYRREILHDFHYSDSIIQEYGFRQINKVPAFFLFNIISLPLEDASGQEARWWPDDYQGLVIDFARDHPLPLITYGTSLLWIVIITISLFKNKIQKQWNTQALLCYFIFCVLFFTFFGETGFPYSQLYTFPLIILVAQSTERYTLKQMLMLILFVCVLFLNNLYHILHFFLSL